MAHTLAALLRRFDPDGAQAPADAVLLRDYVDRRDREAFAALVHRHGPAVYRVCRRLLGPDDAEDAFQATFLVLARRAGAVRKAGSVGSWLVGVAGRVVCEVRRTRRRRAAHEVPLAGEEAAGPAADTTGLERAEHLRALDEELTRLPDHLRGPLVACLLQGRTSDEAAAALGSSPRTVRRRVEQARRVLRARLERRGVTPAVAAGLVAAAGEGAAIAPAELSRKTVVVLDDFLAGGTSPPAALAHGVVKATTPRTAAATLAITAACLTAFGVGLAGGQPSGRVPLRSPAGTALPVAAPVPDGQRGPVVYYPTRVGDRLTYRFPTADVVQVVTAVERKGDARVVTVQTIQDGGKLAPFAKVEVSDKGLVMLQQGTFRVVLDGQKGRTEEPAWMDRDPPHRMLKLPSSPGEKWDAPISASLPARCVAQKEETVRVPAGEFKAIPVDLFIGDPAVARKPFRYWYAPGVGAVKWETSGEGDVVLKAFARGKE